MQNLPNYKKRLYHVWISMKQRCFNPNSTKYKNYGARGIKVCDEWKNSYKAFEEWAYANGYDDNAQLNQCTIDRIDTNGNYGPSNCRWVNSKIQGNNKTDNRTIIIDGVSHTMSEWCDIYHITPRQVDSRVRICGWSYEQAITTPIKKCGWQHSEEVSQKIRNRFLTYGNETKSLSEWARQLGTSESTLSARIDRRGWSVEKALTTPIRSMKKNGRT